MRVVDIGKHISDHWESKPSYLSFIASLAHDTKTLRLGSGTAEYPLDALVIADTINRGVDDPRAT